MNSSITWKFWWRLPVQNHLKPSITQKRQNKAKSWPEIPKELSLWRRPACQTLSKALDMSSAAARVALDLLKSLAILSDTTQNICSWSRRRKIILEIRKRRHFSGWSKNLLFKSFSKPLLSTERRLIEWQFLAVALSPTFVNTGTTD